MITSPETVYLTNRLKITITFKTSNNKTMGYAHFAKNYIINCAHYSFKRGGASAQCGRTVIIYYGSESNLFCAYFCAQIDDVNVIIAKVFLWDCESEMEFNDRY